MQQNFYKIKKYTNWILDFVLGILGLLIILFMLRYLYDISTYILKPTLPANFSMVMQEVISFFMLFEFIMMILAYIQEGHHIPIRYLILICITAILRQLMVFHGEGMQTLLLALSILLLVIVLYVLGLNGSHFFMADKTKYEEDKVHGSKAKKLNKNAERILNGYFQPLYSMKNLAVYYFLTFFRKKTNKLSNITNFVG